MGDIVERQLKSGRKVYYARYVAGDGGRRQRATGQLNKRDALRWLHRVEAQIRTDRVRIVEPTKDE